jgi:hypothetical protein
MNPRFLQTKKESSRVSRGRTFLGSVKKLFSECILCKKDFVKIYVAFQTAILIEMPKVVFKNKEMFSSRFSEIAFPM